MGGDRPLRAFAVQSNGGRELATDSTNRARSEAGPLTPTGT